MTPLQAELENLSVKITRRADMDRQLNRAVERLRERAHLQPTRGILVTRHSATDFTLELDSSVPFGTTHEEDAW